MKKKFLLTLLAIVCAFCCAFGFSACGGGKNTSKVKDEAQWKQAIADARESDKIMFSAEYNKDNNTTEILVEAAGNVQYMKYIVSNDIWEYYYDGDYVYLNVLVQNLGYTWQKIAAETVTEEFPEPLSFIENVYSGTVFDLTFDGLDELSNRYADAQYGFDSDKYGADSYVIIDGDINEDGIAYTLNFNLDRNYLRLNINSSGFNLLHRMGESLNVTIPTDSVGVADNN